MKKGFSLIEILIGVTLFLFFIVGPIATFVFAFKVEKKIFEERELLDSGSYILEYMGRFLRMAQRDDDGTCISSGFNYETTSAPGPGIKFINYKGQCQQFYLENKHLKEEVNSNIYDISPKNIEITNFLVFLKGERRDDDKQPLVTIMLQLQSVNNPLSKINLQTSISQRNLDISQ